MTLSSFSFISFRKSSYVIWNVLIFVAFSASASFSALRGSIFVCVTISMSTSDSSLYVSFAVEPNTIAKMGGFGSVFMYVCIACFLSKGSFWSFSMSSIVRIAYTSWLFIREYFFRLPSFSDLRILCFSSSSKYLVMLWPYMFVCRQSSLKCIFLYWFL